MYLHVCMHMSSLKLLVRQYALVVAVAVATVVFCQSEVHAVFSWCVCLFVCLFVCSFVRSFVRSFVCLFVCFGWQGGPKLMSLDPIMQLHTICLYIDYTHYTHDIHDD